MKEQVRKFFSKGRVETVVLCLSVYVIMRHLLLPGMESDSPLISILSIIGISVLCTIVWFNFNVVNDVKEVESTEPIIEEPIKTEEVIEKKIKPKAKLRKIINDASVAAQVEFVPKQVKKKKSEFPIDQPKKKRKPKQKKSDSSQNNFE